MENPHCMSFYIFLIQWKHAEKHETDLTPTSNWVCLWSTFFYPGKRLWLSTFSLDQQPSKNCLLKSSGSPHSVFAKHTHLLLSYTQGPVSTIPLKGAGPSTSSTDATNWTRKSEAQAHIPFHYVAATTSKEAGTPGGVNSGYFSNGLQT